MVSIRESHELSFSLKHSRDAGIRLLPRGINESLQQDWGKYVKMETDANGAKVKKLASVLVGRRKPLRESMPKGAATDGCFNYVKLKKYYDGFSSKQHGMAKGASRKFAKTFPLAAKRHFGR